jgi:hypothetical protein
MQQNGLRMLCGAVGGVVGAPVVSERLAELIATPDDAGAASIAAEVLAGQGALPARVSERLAELARTGRTAAYAVLWRP